MIKAFAKAYIFLASYLIKEHPDVWDEYIEQINIKGDDEK